jgi:hypothetical protein
LRMDSIKISKRWTLLSFCRARYSQSLYVGGRRRCMAVFDLPQSGCLGLLQLPSAVLNLWAFLLQTVLGGQKASPWADICLRPILSHASCPSNPFLDAPETVN